MYIPVRNTPPAVPRRVAAFGILLSLSLALLGVFGSYLVARINGTYQEILARQLPSIGIVREVSQTNALGRRLIDSLSVDVATSEIERVELGLSAHRDINTLRLARLEGLLNSEEGSRLTDELLNARKVYRLEIDAFLRAIRAGMTVGDRADWNRRISEADAQYVVTQDRLAEYCSRSATAVAEKLSQRSAKLNGYFLIIAAWPLLLALMFFIYGLCSTLILFYRSRR